MQQVKHIPGRGRAYIAASYFWGRTSENSVPANFLELRKTEVQLPRIILPRTPVNKGANKKGQSPRRSSDPSRSSAARALLLGRRALVGRRGRCNRHSW